MKVFHSIPEGMEIDSTSENCDINSLVMASENIPSCSSSTDDWQIAEIDDSNISIEKGPLERFVSYLDKIDTKVEKLRKEAVDLQEKKDTLLVSIDLVKNHEALAKMDEYEREEINYYIQRVSSRLGTVDLHVKTVRDTAQEESLHQINVLIDSLITSGDPTSSRHRCQTFLNGCNASDMSVQKQMDDVTLLHIDKKFENFLLGCALDDQKNIKKRLQALIIYLNKQIVTD